MQINLDCLNHIKSEKSVTTSWINVEFVPQTCSVTISVVTAGSSQQDICHSRMVTAGSSQQDRHNRIVTARSSQQERHSRIVTARSSQQDRHSRTVTAGLSQQDCHISVVTVVSSLSVSSQQYCHSSSSQ